MNTATDTELRLLIESAHRFLTDKRAEILSGAYRDTHQFSSLWRECADMGWLLTCVPAEADGAGMDTAAAAALLEAVGSRLLPMPVGPGVSVAALMACVKGAGERLPIVGEWLRGERLAGIVDGQFVRYAASDVALRLSWDANQLTVETLAATSAGYGVDPLLPVARHAAVQHHATLACGEPVWRQYVARSRAMMLAEALGAASGALELAVEYARERTQFGRAIGANQAVKHPLANNRMAIDDARLALHDACAAIDAAAPDSEARLLTAELLVSEAAHATVAQAIQTHGALGFTWECPVHFHFKRVKHIAAALRQERDPAAILHRLWQLSAY